MVGRSRIRYWLQGAVWAALAVVLSGCGSPREYPADLHFPSRDDRLVLRVPTREPLGIGEPGKLDAELAALDSLGGRTLDPTSSPPEARTALNRYLAETFGTPAAPVVKHDAAERLGLPPSQLAEGGKLYRRHCLQCHGLTGDGRGPTGQWIYPHPRDFRRGSYKFVTTGDGGKPRRDDLHRTIRDGLKGTAMPGFGLLPEQERDLMAGYVMFLSVRGQVEFQTLTAIMAEGESGNGVDGDVPGYAAERFQVVLREWERGLAAPQSPTPPKYPDEAARFEAVRRGFELFTAPGASGCITCHQDYGRQATYRYDVWGTVVRPTELTSTTRKGGERLEDIFQRIRGGIQPAGMPAHPSLTESQVWDLAQFVRVLPFSRDLPPDLRTKIYPGQ